MSDLRKFLELVSENSMDECIEIRDTFEIELNESFTIETGVVGFTKDGIILEADEIMCKLLNINGVILESIEGDDYDAEYDDEAGMADNNLETLRRAVEGLDELIQPGDNLPEWCQEKIAVAKGMLVAVWDYMESEQDRGAPAAAQDFKDSFKTESYEEMDEAEYQGRKVSLGKPMQGDVKKSKVYVRKPNGKVVKVNFGDKTMRIKKSIPGRRKSFRARHHCENPGPKWKARYWSCRAW